jgi:hypothetical protein
MHTDDDEDIGARADDVFYVQFWDYDCRKLKWRSPYIVPPKQLAWKFTLAQVTVVLPDIESIRAQHNLGRFLAYIGLVAQRLGVVGEKVPPAFQLILGVNDAADTACTSVIFLS